MYFLVFTGRKWQNAMGKSGMTWEVAGIWDADTEEQACLLACQEMGVGTAFAVQGYAWGVDTMRAGQASKLGEQLDPIARLERMGQQLSDRLAAALPAPARQHLEEGDIDGE